MVVLVKELRFRYVYIQNVDKNSTLKPLTKGQKLSKYISDGRWTKSRSVLSVGTSRGPYTVP